MGAEFIGLLVAGIPKRWNKVVKAALVGVLEALMVVMVMNKVVVVLVAASVGVLAALMVVVEEAALVGVFEAFENS